MKQTCYYTEFTYTQTTKFTINTPNVMWCKTKSAFKCNHPKCFYNKLNKYDRKLHIYFSMTLKNCSCHCSYKIKKTIWNNINLVFIHKDWWPLTFQDYMYSVLQITHWKWCWDKEIGKDFLAQCSVLKTFANNLQLLTAGEKCIQILARYTKIPLKSWLQVHSEQFSI